MLVLFALRLTYQRRAKDFPRSVSFEDLPELVRNFMGPRVEVNAPRALISWRI